MPTQGMRLVRGGEQGFNRSPNGIYHFGLECAHYVYDFHLVVGRWVHSASQPRQPDDRWMVTYPRALLIPPVVDPRFLPTLR
jgi:hypothetical protein